MSSNNRNNRMKNKLLDAIPIGTGSAGAISPMYLDTITWHGVGDLAAQAAVLALVGGIIGWIVKRILDKIFNKKK